MNTTKFEQVDPSINAAPVSPLVHLCYMKQIDSDNTHTTNLVFQSHLVFHFISHEYIYISCWSPTAHKNLTKNPSLWRSNLIHTPLHTNSPSNSHNFYVMDLVSLISPSNFCLLVATTTLSHQILADFIILISLPLIQFKTTKIQYWTNQENSSKVHPS